MNFPVSYDDITLDIPDNKGIYIPAEDSFLLLDMLKDFLDMNPMEIKSVSDPVLDMGAGNGLATLLLAKYFMNIHSVDINPFATQFIWQEARRRSRELSVYPITASMLDVIRAGSVRYYLACFNPPYLPPEDYDNRGIQADDLHNFYMDNALYAPDNGRRVLELFLKSIKDFMRAEGHVFFIKSSLTGIDDIDELTSNFGLCIVDCRKVHRFFEDIEGYHAIV